VASATNFGTLTSLSQTGLTLHTTTDVDYYTAAAGSKSTYTVTISPTQGSGLLSLTVLNAQQTVLASGQSQTGGVTLSVSLASGQQYYVKVYSPSGGLFVYNLSIAKASAGGGGGGGGGHKLVPAGDFFRADGKEEGEPDAAVSDPGQAPSGPQSPGASVARTPASVAAFVTEGRDGLAQLPAGVFHDGANTQRGLTAAVPNFGQQAVPLVSAALPVPAGVATRSLSGAAPELRPPVAPAEGDDDDEVLPSEEDAEQVDGPVLTVRPAGDPEAMVPVGMQVRQQALDAGFADSSWRANPAKLEMPVGALAAEGSAPATNAAAAATLAFFLGGCADAHRPETELRRRRGFRM
jgi:hypothetical protein